MPEPEPAPIIPVRSRATGPGSGGARTARQALRELLTRRAEQARAGVVPVARDRPLPLSFAGQRLWFLDQWSPGTSTYNAPLALRLDGPLDVAALGAALATVVARHEVLRTRYGSERGVPFQIIDPPSEAVELSLVDLSALPASQRVGQAESIAVELARKPFDLATGPVLRARLIRLAPEEHRLVLCLHHIATDGWSTGVLTRELMAAYRAGRDDAEALPELPVQYADYAVWQRGQASSTTLAGQLAYWRGKLADLPALDFPTDRARPLKPTYRGATLTRLLPERLREELAELARGEQSTMLTVLLAGFTALLARYTGQEDIVIGSVFSGRTRPEIESMIGFFANTLVMRTSAEGNPAFRELLARTNQTVLGAHLNQELSFDKLVEELRPDRDPSRNPLFQISFTLQNATGNAVRLDRLTARVEAVETGTARFDLAVQATELPGEGLLLWAEYSTELFDTERIARLLESYGRVLAQVAADPTRHLGDLDLLGPEETARARRHAVAPADLDRPERLLHELFEERAARRPDDVACRFLGADTIYAELDARAGALARRLRGGAEPVAPESVVGVLLHRGPELPAALLGVLKAGGAYLPLDPFHPPERIALLLADAGCRVVVTSRELAGLVPAGVRQVLVDGDDADPVPPAPRSRPPLRGDNPAYVIYTSGSTGRPKGVVVPHRQAVNFVLAIVALFRLGPGDRVLQFANPSFDVSVFDFFSALCSGARLVQAPVDTLHHPRTLATLLREERVTVTDLPPTVLSALDPLAFPELRTLFVGLEPYPDELVNQWNIAGREFHNGYGPTEATVACVDHLCPHERLTGAPPIGLPMANYTAYVLDRWQRLAPVGVPGELYIGGAGVARGYLGRPDLTAERFLPDPFGPPGSRMYRTGDLARRRDDGVLTFLGRTDSQIKIRGLRVEPGEVEAALIGHPDVRTARVVARVDGADRQLVAYVVAEEGRNPRPDELRQYVAGRLPPGIVPSAYVLLDELPRNVNGKVDLARLPAPEGTSQAPATPPRTPTERRLAEIWANVLGVEEVSVHDDFFMLGGNSLKFIQIAARVREAFGVPLQLQALFASPTIAALAALIEEAELAAADPEQILALLAEVQAEGDDRSPAR